MRAISGAAVALSAAALCGCLVSKEPLFDAATASATPLTPGSYELCPLTEDKTGEMATCDPLTVELGEDGLYLFSPSDEEGEEPTEGRFRAIGKLAWAVQFKEKGDGGYQYFYARRKSGEFQLAMMSCSDLPRPLADRLIADGEMEKESDDLCRVKSTKAVIKSADAYRRGKVAGAEYAALRPVEATATK
jgi:hypothetical protein